MQPFSYSLAAQSRSAVQAAAKPGAQLLAGGTNLLDLVKLNVMQPRALIDINALPLAQITFDASRNVVRIGALVRNSDLAHDPTIQAKLPALSAALLSGASPQLRNMATVGGNLLQRTRCPYFNDVAYACNKRHPGSGCSAIGGFTRSHAVLGTSADCIATHPSDMCVAMAALGAVVLTTGNGGDRRLAFGDLHLLPENHPEREHALQPGELITGVEIAATPLAARSVYLKVRDRASYQFALASVAASYEVSAGRITSACIALGGVATKPWRATAAETALLQTTPGEATFSKAAEIALAGAKTQPHNGFKVDLARRLIVHALTKVGGSV